MSGSRRSLLFALPLIAAAGLGGMFLFGLNRDPNHVPSNLIDRPAPQFDLPGLAGGRFTDADLPQGEAAVVNCAAGKDRTGILCALTHYTLGVDDDTIIADYELTNEAADVAERLPEAARQFNAYIGKDYPDEVYHPFVGVHRDFLDAALESIVSRSGGIEAYLAEHLKVGDPEIEVLRSKFLV